MHDALVVTVAGDQVGAYSVERGGWQSLELSLEQRAALGSLWVQLVGGDGAPDISMRPALDHLGDVRSSVEQALSALQQPLAHLTSILTLLTELNTRLERIESHLRSNVPDHQWMLQTLAPAVERRKPGGQ